MKRRLHTIGALLLGGVIANVAVSWICAIRAWDTLFDAGRYADGTDSELGIHWHQDYEPDILEAHVGLPMPAMRCAIEPLSPDGAWNVINGIGLGDEGVLPLVAMWPGFAVNTVVYAIAICLAAATLPAWRGTRRAKRGLCPGCAYPVGISPACSECGRPI